LQKRREVIERQSDKPAFAEDEPPAICLWRVPLLSPTWPRHHGRSICPRSC